MLKRRKEIELHFEKILKNAKTPKQINGYYHRVIENLIIHILQKKGVFKSEDFYFYYEDIPILNSILEEHYLKQNILNKLK